MQVYYHSVALRDFDPKASRAGALPAGLSLDSAKGTLSGTPTATGTFHFTVQVTDSAQATLPQAYDLTVTAPALSK